MWTLLRLAATVWSFAHMPLGISDRSTTTRIMQWPRNCLLPFISLNFNWGGLSFWNSHCKNFSKRGIWTMRFYELIWYWKSQIDPRFSKMFDHIGSLPYISTVPLRLHAAHVWRLQVFQGGGKSTMNKSLNCKRIVSKLSVFLKVSLLLPNNKSKFSYNVTSHK